MDFRLNWARAICADGRHNAFTGITSAHGRTLVTFRSAASHMSQDGSVALLHSSDAQAWQAAAPARVAGLDLRDPKPVWFQDRLWVYCGARGQDLALHSLRIPVSPQLEMGSPESLQGLPDGRWLWHVQPRGERLYGSAYWRVGKGFAAALYTSDDGLRWRWLADFPAPGNEAFLDFDTHGTLWVLLRNDDDACTPTLCSATPPYAGFDTARPLPLSLQGPLLKRMAGGNVLIGRQWDNPGHARCRTELLWLPDGGQPEHRLTLPSGGDTSYAGWLDLAPGRALVSYYSSHAQAGAEASAAEAATGSRPRCEHPADIWLAEIAYAA